jgi:hypothetical protein
MVGADDEEEDDCDTNNDKDALVFCGKYHRYVDVC